MQAGASAEKTFPFSGGAGDTCDSSPTHGRADSHHRRRPYGRTRPALSSITGSPVQIYQFE